MYSDRTRQNAVPQTKKEALQGLQEAVNSRAKVRFWEHGSKGAVHDAIASELTQESFCVDCSLDSLNTNAKYDVSIELGRTNLLFQTSFREIVGQRIFFLIPEKVFKIQRRKSFRVRVLDENWEAEIFFLEKDQTKSKGRPPKIKTQVFDISAEGISLILPEKYADFFTISTQLSNIVFKIEKKEFRLMGKVNQVKVQKIKEASFLRLGIQFDRMSKADEHALSRAVFNVNRDQIHFLLK
ncbi:MAG: PilZ domain-containing protein [Bacteriovoracia bacterium]